jgi:hypothetical protein
MALPTHPLGNSGLHITRVGFGSWVGGGGRDLDEIATAMGRSNAGSGPAKSRESRALKREVA